MPEQWHHCFSSPIAGAAEVLRAADYALNRLSALGIVIPSGCRLLRARRVVEHFGKDVLNADRGVLAEATRTIWDFYIIARACGGSGVAGRRLRESLVHALSGPLSLGDETCRNSRARNAQFEMYVGAWLTAGGAHIQQAEPDWQVMIGKQAYGVAVKRVRSRPKILARVREGARQLLALKQGFVVLNVDPHLEALELSRDPVDAGAAFVAALPEMDAAYSYLQTREHVRGLVILGTIVRSQQQSAEQAPLISMQSFARVRLMPDDEPEAVLLSSFWQGLSTMQKHRFSRV